MSYSGRTETTVAEMLAGLDPLEHAPRVTEREMLTHLRARYTKIRPGTDADQFVRAQHVRYPQDYGHAAAIADYIVLDTWTPHDIIGFEIKVTRSDWLTELRDPRKAEYWRKHCHRWYLVTSHREIVRNDLPHGWGHMTLTPRGLRIITRAPALAAEPMNPSAMNSLGRSIAKTREKELTDALAAERKA